jgi:hypothetical protein
MEKPSKLEAGTIVAIIIFAIGGFIGYGRNENRIAQLEMRQAAVEAKQTQTDTYLQSIDRQLTELNTKMSLLLDGKLKGGSND